MRMRYLLILFLLLPFAYADGMMHIKIEDQDMWNLLDEGKQMSVIKHQKGIQHMLLKVDIGQEMDGEKAVWIFPVPAPPERTDINIFKAFPRLLGNDVIESFKDDYFDMVQLHMASQIYPLPLFLFTNARSFNDALGGIEKGQYGGVEVHSIVQKMGLTTELITAKDASSLDEYLAQKDLILPNDSRDILDEYIGQDFSFVVSWVSDFETFKRSQPTAYVVSLIKNGEIAKAKSFMANLTFDRDDVLYDINRSMQFDPEEIIDIMDSEYYYRRGRDHHFNLAVYISFPTEKAFYPLRPTSVYGDKVIPTYVYILDYVEPIVYDKINEYTSTDYFIHNRFSPPDSLKKFFDYAEFSDLRYTKISIEAPSENLKEDIWFETKTPVKVSVALSFNSIAFIWGLTLFLIVSGLSSLLAGKIIFRKDVSWWKLCLLGLSNILTIVSFIIATTFVGLKKAKENKREGKNHKPLIFFIIYTFLILLYLLAEIDILDYWVTDIIFLLGIPLILVTLAILSSILSEKTSAGYVVDLRKIILFVILTAALIVFSIVEYLYGEEILILILILMAFYFLCVILLNRYRKFHYDLTFRRDIRKVWFIILFSVIFMVLSVIHLIVFNMIF